MQYGRRGLRHAHESRSASLGVSVVHFHLGGRSAAGHGARGGGGPLQCAPRRTGGPRWRSHTVPSDREGPQRGVRRAGDEPLPKVDRNDRHRPMHVPDTAPHASNPYVGRVEDDAQPPTRRWAPSRVWVLHTHSSSSAAASPIPCLQDMSDLGTQREWRGLLRRFHDPWSRSSTLTAEDAPRVVTPAELYGLLR